MEPARSRRSKTISTKVKIVTEEDKKNVAKARLDALENDETTLVDEIAGESDEEFQLEDFEDDSELNLGGHRKKKRRKGGPSMGVGAQRRTRAGLLETKGPKTFMALLEEAELDLLPRDEPSYASAAVQASKVASSRPWCTVCGFQAPYTCTRCSSRFCSRKCYALHSETRCLKFTT